jgi:hypothetical protein
MQCRPLLLCPSARLTNVPIGGPEVPSHRDMERWHCDRRETLHNLGATVARPAVTNADLDRADVSPQPRVIMRRSSGLYRRRGQVTSLATCCSTRRRGRCRPGSVHPVWQKLHTLRGSRAGTWLHRVAVNLMSAAPAAARDLPRRRRRRCGARGRPRWSGPISGLPSSGQSRSRRSGHVRCFVIRYGRL